MNKNKKFYEFEIEEHNGEQEYSWRMGCWATSEKSALIKARRYAKHFYDTYEGKAKEVSENVFEFPCGIQVELNFYGEGNFDEFQKRLVEAAVIQ